MAVKKRHLLSYLAGLFDGEGYVGIVKAGQRKDTSGIYSANLFFGNTSKYVVQLWQNTFGGIIHTENPRNKRCKPFYRWEIRGTFALPILKELLPYTLIKRPQLEVAIHFLENVTPRSKGAKKLTEKDLALREADYILCRDLKREI